MLSEIWSIYFNVTLIIYEILVTVKLEFFLFYVTFNIITTINYLSSGKTSPARRNRNMFPLSTPRCTAAPPRSGPSRTPSVTRCAAKRRSGTRPWPSSPASRSRSPGPRAVPPRRQGGGAHGRPRRGGRGPP